MKESYSLWLRGAQSHFHLYFGHNNVQCRKENVNSKESGGIRLIQQHQHHLQKDRYKVYKNGRQQTTPSHTAPVGAETVVTLTLILLTDTDIFAVGEIHAQNAYNVHPKKILTWNSNRHPFGGKHMENIKHIGGDWSCDCEKMGNYQEKKETATAIIIERVTDNTSIAIAIRHILRHRFLGNGTSWVAVAIRWLAIVSASDSSLSRRSAMIACERRGVRL